MKDEAYYDTSTPLRTIYGRNVKLLLNAKYKLTGIQSPLIGGLLPFQRFIGTLASRKEAIDPPLN